MRTRVLAFLFFALSAYSALSAASFSAHSAYSATSFSGYSALSAASFSAHSAYSAASFSAYSALSAASFSAHSAYSAASFSAYSALSAASFSAYSTYSAASFSAHSAYSAADTEAWRSRREQELLADGGWLTVAGLVFLRPGVNTVGSDRDSDVVLPAPAPRHAGRLVREGTVVSFEPDGSAPVLLNGAAAAGRVQLTPQDRLSYGAVTFHLHESGERIGIRIRDANSELRRTFKGLRWFPVRDAWTVDAKFEPYESPRQITVANVLGDYEKLTLPGEVIFRASGQEVRLQAARAGSRLWFIFSDAGGGRETYRIRFLYADAPSADRRVTLDFNRAYNPPCAYNPFTTCPVPPPQNRLRIAIPAGERIYRAH